MAASTAQDMFMIVVTVTTNAAITISDVTAGLAPGGFVDLYAWSVRFTYMSGTPAATGFRLNSADGLTGTFSPSAPQGIGSGVKHGLLYGTVQIQIPPGDSVTYNGTITILQA